MFFSFSQFPARTPPPLLRRIRRTPVWWPAPPRRQRFSFPLPLPLLLRRRSRTRLLLRLRSQPRLPPRRSRRSSRPPTIGDVRFLFPFSSRSINSIAHQQRGHGRGGEPRSARGGGGRGGGGLPGRGLQSPSPLATSRLESCSSSSSLVLVKVVVVVDGARVETL